LVAVRLSEKGRFMQSCRQASLRHSLGRSLWFGLLAAIAGSTASANLRADDSIQLLGVAELPGTTVDKSGLQGRLEDGTPHNQLGGLSAIDYSGADDIYYVLSDRGPKDGTVRFHCRWHAVELKLPHEGRGPATARLVGTTLLSATDGKPMTGVASAFDPNGPDGNHRFDPEGLRRGPGGNVFLSDEYGPMVIEFDSSGHEVRSLDIPARYKISHPAATKEEEISQNQSGRIANAGMEGLAISPDGSRLYALEQMPLLQDSKPSKKGKPQGLNCRLLEIDLKSGATREFVYPLDNTKTKLSEILAAGDGKFLVIERDGALGSEAAFKKIMAIDIKNATDSSHIAKLPAKGLPKGVHPVKKSTFIDLLDPRFGLAGSKLPEKIEGLAWGPSLPDGRAVLWVCVDNDFKSEAPNLFYAFAVPRGAMMTAH
jgi:hypothetical protein